MSTRRPAVDGDRHLLRMAIHGSHNAIFGPAGTGLYETN
jgi:hypothetical protein